MTGSLQVGVDVARAEHVVEILSPAGSPAGRLRVPNSPAGGSQLITWLLDRADHLAASEIRVGMEATNIYWWHLFHQLLAHEQLRTFPTHLFLLNPHDVAHFKKALGVVDKSDPVDARTIAHYLRFRTDLHEAYTPEPRYEALQILTRARFQLAHVMAQEKNRVLARVFQAFSAYGKDRPFTDVFGATSQHVLADLTVSEIVSLELPCLAQRVFLDGADAYFPAERQGAILQQLVQLAQQSYRCDAYTESALRTAIRARLALIRQIQQQMRQLEQAIEERMADLPAHLQSIPGIGPVFEAGIVAEIGPIQRFRDDDQVARFAGLTWRINQSGEFEADTRPLTRRGNSYLRYYLCEAANSVRVHEAGTASYYARKFAEARHHPHKRALVLTARRLLRTIYALLKRGEAFDPARRIA
jgi:transposase